MYKNRAISILFPCVLMKNLVTLDAVRDIIYLTVRMSQFNCSQNFLEPCKIKEIQFFKAVQDFLNHLILWLPIVVE
jgi:hypothetical protein